MILYCCFTKYARYKEVKFLMVGFEETHVMIFIGFAYLMTFLKKYCYSATGFNLLLAALVIQWSLLCQGFFHMSRGKIVTTPKLLLEADIMAATVLITFGALLGITTGSQMLFLAVIEAAVGSVNMFISQAMYEITDIGGSILIHTYGAYFGLGVSAALRIKKPAEEEKIQMRPREIHSHTSAGHVISVHATRAQTRLDGPSYASDVSAMLGSLFLWVFWPLFNSGLAVTEMERQRAFVNTYLSLASCTVVTFVLSAAVSHKPGKFDMVHIQNSTLAGGVAVGAVANLHITPGGAVAIGMGAACISVLGFRYLTPKLEKRGIQDTCGVNNLHGMPGIYSGLISVLVSLLATEEVYGRELAVIFPATKHKELEVEPRSMETQALYQLVALITTFVVAILTGLLCGFIIKSPIFTPLKVKERYDDDVHWELP
ncbi:hypothetical protein PYW07_012423 [Mythimna separata]|uniref:Ammonium transporter AmtB-like domain-containing protein n=1 Tax=Mythimna separata TaxID=271217 RepID=A0AAD7YM72_MYTSE|nr:hypothetical protein PYW07_012423 [Mythimna separata]